MIPLRGGSKSIPLKNIKPFNGRPLVFWVLDAAVNCSKIDRVFVATEHEAIAAVVQGYHSNRIEVIGRSLASSADTAPTEMAALEFAALYDFENIALIQATSPLLQSEHLEMGWRRLEEDGVDSVLSVVRQRRFIWEAKPNNRAVPVNYDPGHRPRRQDFAGFLVENGAFYMTSKDLLVKNRRRLSGNISYIEMPEETYFEMDEWSDWRIAEALMRDGLTRRSVPHQPQSPPH
jgi:CMP-N-acetylneuraminic acid synthetase